MVSLSSPRLRVVTLGLLFLLALTVARSAGAQALSADEQRIVAAVEETVDEGLALLEATVNINSGTLHPEGVRAVAEAMRPSFEAIGLDVRYSPVPDSLNRGGHLVASKAGDQGNRLLLIGHLDTVFEPDHPFQTYERDGDTARGPGVTDMKGGNVVIWMALKALHDAGLLENVGVTVVLTGDEERPGRPLSVSRAALIEAARQSDVALGFEGASRDGDLEYGVLARRSSSGWTLTVQGRQGHSSGVFSEGSGYGAIFEAARILDAFREALADEQYLTFNPGAIVGGTDVTFDPAAGRGTAYGKTNVIAQTVRVVGDIRTLTDEQLERTRERMRAIVADHLPQTSATIAFSDGYPSMPPTAGNQALFDVLNDVNQDLGRSPLEVFDPGRRGAADISFVAPHVQAGLAALGPYGAGSHSPDETLDLTSLDLAAKRAALLIYRLTRPGAEAIIEESDD